MEAPGCHRSKLCIYQHRPLPCRVSNYVLPELTLSNVVSMYLHEELLWRTKEVHLRSVVHKGPRHNGVIASDTQSNVW